MRHPAWQCLSVSLWTSPLGGHTHQSPQRKTSCPQSPWEVGTNCRKYGKITGGHFSVSPDSSNPKMNFTYQQPQSKECFPKKSDQQWKIEFKVSRAQLWMLSWYLMLSKAHLTSHSRMSGSRSVITPLWLSGSWRSFLEIHSLYIHVINDSMK